MVDAEVHPAVKLRTARAGQATTLVPVGEMSAGLTASKKGPGECASMPSQLHDYP